MNQTDLIASLFEDITLGLRITFVMVRSCFRTQMQTHKYRRLEMGETKYELLF